MVDTASRRSATALLGVPETAGVEVVRSAFFQKLSECGFVPPEESVAAVCRAPIPRTHEVLDRLAGFERADVEIFLGRYWALAPIQRQTEWDELNSYCTDPVAGGTLNRTVQGLSLVVCDYEAPEVERLAKLLRELYVLPRREAGRRWMEWLLGRSNAMDFAALELAFEFQDSASATIAPELSQMMHAMKFELHSAAPLSYGKIAAWESEPEDDDRVGEEEPSESELLAIDEEARLYSAMGDFDARSEANANPPERRLPRWLWVIVWSIFIFLLLKFTV